MKKIILFLISLLIIQKLFCNTTKINIDKNEIKIGEKVTLSFTIENKGEIRVLKEELSVTPPIEIITERLEIKPEAIKFLYEISSFTAGDFKDLSMKIPVAYKSGDIEIIETDSFSLIVKSILTEDEKIKLENTKEPDQVELKKSIDIKKFRFYIEGFIFWILFILVITFLILFIYKFIIKKIKVKNKTGKEDDNKIIGFEKFLFSIERITIETENRKEIEYKLSLLSETLKEFIRWAFKFNATSETTKELIKSMRESDIEQKLISETGLILNNLDMIKFAKAEIDANGFKNYLMQIKELGIAINNYSKRDQQ